MKGPFVRLLLASAFAVTLGGSAHAAEIQRQKFLGNQANAGFYGSNSVTCADGTTGVVSAFGTLNGAEQIYSSNTFDFMGNGVIVQLESYFNSCTGVAFGYSQGGITNGFTPPDKHLISAVMAGDTMVQDYGSGAQIPVSINVTITGTGNTYSSKSNSQSKITGSKTGPLSITMSHSQNVNRMGDAAGTISIEGVSINAQFYFAFMNYNDNASLSVSK